MIQQGILFFIQSYRKFLSPLLGGRCRFEPSCSAYAEEAIKNRGAFCGLGLFLIRIAKCHPFHPGGFDPLEQ